MLFYVVYECLIPLIRKRVKEINDELEELLKDTLMN